LRAFRQSQTPRSQGQSLKDQIAQRLKDKASRLSDTDARTADDYHNEQAAIIAEQMEGLESRVEARIRAQQESAPKQRSSGHVGLVAKFPWADEPENGAAVAAMAKKIMAAEDLDSNDDATVWRSAERACVIIAKQFGLSVPGGAAQGATTGAAGGALGGPSGGPTPAPTRLALDQANYWAKNLQTDPKIRAMPPAQLWPVFFRKVVAPQVGKK
jgi:hypothetical protein